MKPFKLLLILSTFALTFYSVPLRAEDDEGGDGDHNSCQNDDQNENCQGGTIDGTETLVATVALLPTTNAPDGASGLANLVSNNQTGVVTYTFSLSVKGLDAGTYDLSIVRKSDGSTVDIGQFNVGSTNLCHGGGEDEDENDDQRDGGDCQKRWCWAAFLDAADVQLPPDLDPMDIGQILISDLNGNVLLTGDLVNPSTTSKIKFVAKLRVHSASGATVSTSLNNKAQAHSTAKRGKLDNRFTMVASGVAPNSTYSVVVNGQTVGTAKSNRKGKILVSKLSANLLTVRAVHLVDGNGNTAVRAKF